MAQMLGFGTTGTSQWRYLAQRMEEALGDLSTSQAVTRQILPLRLLQAARDFFANALSADSDHGNDDPSVTIANYRLAAQALRSTLPSIAREGRDKLDETLRAYAGLLDVLQTEGPISKTDLQRADELKKFFHQLFSRADVAAYTESVLGEDDLEGQPFCLNY